MRRLIAALLLALALAGVPALATASTPVGSLSIPAMGISQRVYDWPCRRAGTLPNLVFRWDCAGAGNLYLMGHAYGVFRELRWAYLHHRLYRGERVYWTSGGRRHLYVVRWWTTMLRSRPDVYVGGSRTPVMTLQTCVWNVPSIVLIVRLARVY